MGQALFREVLSASDESLLIFFFGRKDGDDVVFGVGFVALISGEDIC